MAAFRRSQPAVADRAEPRLFGPSPAARMDEPAVAQRRDAEAEADWLATREAQGRARRKAASEPEDRSLASLLPPDGRWNQLLDASSTWGNGAELERVSVKDYVRYDESSTNVNWRLGEGYGRLFEKLAEGLPVALETPVTRIDHQRTRDPARHCPRHRDRGAGHRHRADLDPGRRNHPLRSAAARQNCRGSRVAVGGRRQVVYRARRTRSQASSATDFWSARPCGARP